MAVDVAEQFASWVSQAQDAEQRKVDEMKVRNRQLENVVPAPSLIPLSKDFSDQFTKLDKELRDVSNDLERERVAARQTQEDWKSVTRQLEELKEAVVRIPPTFRPLLLRKIGR